MAYDTPNIYVTQVIWTMSYTLLTRPKELCFRFPHLCLEYAVSVYCRYFLHTIKIDDDDEKTAHLFKVVASIEHITCAFTFFLRLRFALFSPLSDWSVSLISSNQLFCFRN